MSAEVLNKDTCLAALPPEWPEDLLPAIQARVGTARHKIVVLDDDPTGTQTVHGLPVLTTWAVEDLREALLSTGPGFFILTNSRSQNRQAACALSVGIGTNLRTASERTGIPIEVISRSDSTLRGHFPHEVDTVATALGIQARPYLLLPFFPEGGRFTINDIHFVAENDHLVPAAMTPYARDDAFGYAHSDLKAWVAEKTGGLIPSTAVTSISLDEIRTSGPERVAERLCAVPDGAACIVNAAAYRDVEVLVVGLMAAAERGRRFLYRTAAAFVRVMMGIEPRPAFLSKEELVTGTGSGGLFVVGSYVPKTTAQVRELLARTDIAPVEVRVDRLLAPERREMEIARSVAETNALLEEGRDVVVYTSRSLVSGEDAAASLDIGRTVSDSLVRIVGGIRNTPRYLVAKGGITSSDVATRGLQVRRAMVSGQVMPGVPVWRLAAESRYPGMPYIVFPGNVGDDNALAALQQKLA